MREQNRSLLSKSERIYLVFQYEVCKRTSRSIAGLSALCTTTVYILQKMEANATRFSMANAIVLGVFEGKLGAARVVGHECEDAL